MANDTASPKAAMDLELFSEVLAMDCLLHAVTWVYDLLNSITECLAR